MKSQVHQKVTTDHLKRDAYLYVRQSTVRQVFENTESTKRQYDLRQHAVALGWPTERVVVIDSDQGQSGATADREGFQRLVAEVGMGRVGIVLGLEVSRLARNCADWHRLLEICALTNTLILDGDGLYDPCEFNDRLVLGLKGTMSEAELHVLKARLRGGILNKARRGELQTPLPVGLVYDSNARVRLDPDKEVQESLRQFFRIFRRAGSALAVVKAFREQEWKFPRRLRSGPKKGELVWGPLQHSRALQVLHSPRYAGAFCFGRHRTHKQPDGKRTIELLPRDQWHALIQDAHPGYISWEEFEDNQRRIRECAQAHGLDRRKSPPREGPALLQGLLICGKCGERMTVRYHSRGSALLPQYVCQLDGIKTATPICQTIPGASIDEAVGVLLVEAVTPQALEVALEVQRELQRRIEEADRLRRQKVERARYEADLAQRRYMHVDPDNRLVADQLEAEWNARLRALVDAQEQYEERRQLDRATLEEGERKRILSLAVDFPRLWQSSKTTDRDRKRMVRLLIEDATLIKGDELNVHVRFKGGTAKTLRLPLPQNAWQRRQTPTSVVSEINSLLEHHTDGEVAEQLNEQGFISGEGRRFNARIVQKIRRAYDLASRYRRLRRTGMLTLHEIADLLRVSSRTVKIWRDHGLLRSHRYNDKRECLYEQPGDDPPIKMQGRKLKLAERQRRAQLTTDRPNEVQCEA